jgi:acetyltransferase-like isoleucine patch superfamily enzyme
MPMLSRQQVEALGFASVGKNVQISDRASFYGLGRIHIGNNVRIDDFCVLSAGEGGIQVGSYIHIAVYTSLIGAGKIELSNFCNLSSRVSIYSSSDDYSGATLTNPTVPDKYKNVHHAPVYLGRHVIVGSGSVILPGIRVEEGVAVGALSLVTKNCMPYGIYAGNPAKRIKERKQDLLSLEQRLVADGDAF